MANISRATKVTTDDNKIRKWVESRGGKPAVVKGTEILRIDFPGYSGKYTLQPISWNEFFQKFEQKKLAFLYQEKTASGKRSNFNKLVSRETVAARTGRKKAA